MKVSVLTISDSVSAGVRPDRSGPTIRRLVEVAGHAVVAQAVVPDEALAVSAFLIAQADGGEVELILTTGGTGLAPRDVTPEATRAVINRECPGIAEAIRAESRRHTPTAVLSRAIAGIRGRVLIVNLPGNPRSIEQCLPHLLGPLAHGVDLLNDRATGHPAGDERASHRG